MSFAEVPAKPLTVLSPVGFSKPGATATRQFRLLRSLKNRLVLWLLAVSYGIILLASIAFYWVATSEIESTELQVLSQRMDTVRDWMDSEVLDEPSLYHEVTENNLAPREILMRVIDSRRNVFIETPEMDQRVPLALLPAEKDLHLNIRVDGQVQNEFGDTYKTLVGRLSIGAPNANHWVIIQAAVNTSIDARSTTWFRQLFVVFVIGGFLLCLAVAVFVAGRELAPLEQVTNAARRINSKTLNERLDLEGLPTELSELGREFNQMMERLQTAYAGLRHYADNAAHELRGPVNRMLLEGEVALNRDDDADALRLALESNTDEARHLAKIVDNLLFLARTDNAGMAIEPKPVCLCDIVGRVVDFFDASAEDKGIRLVSECPENVMLPGDRDLLVRAVSNLVGNAIEHTPAGGEIRVSASVENGEIVLTVADTGEGIEPDMLPFVFDRFFRADKARTAGNRIGLGLPITRSIVQLHGGEISVKSRLGHGTEMIMRFAPK